MERELYRYRKVMVIDDSELDRFILHRIFRKLKYARELLFFPSVVGGLDYLKSQVRNEHDLPERIFLDIKMPEMDAFRFLAVYREMPIKSKNIVIVSSTLNTREQAGAKEDPYVFRFIEKPVREEMLVNL